MDNLFKPKKTPFQKMEEFVRVDFSDYKSPIEVYIREQRRKHKQKVEDIIEDNVFREVIAIGVDVDKKELLKALMYDRNQYGDGYAAGVRAATPKWISVEDRLPKHWVDVLAVCDGKVYSGWLSLENEWMLTCNPCAKVTHWMPLPEPPKEE